MHEIANPGKHVFLWSRRMEGAVDFPESWGNSQVIGSARGGSLHASGLACSWLPC